MYNLKMIHNNIDLIKKKNLNHKYLHNISSYKIYDNIVLHHTSYILFTMDWR